MKKIYLSILFIFLFATALFCQNVKITPILSSKLKETKANQPIPVLVILNEQIDFHELKSSFEQRDLPANKRAEETLQLLKDQFENVQTQFITSLAKYENNNTDYFRIERRYWIFNMLLVEATPEVITELSLREDIRYLEYADQKITLIEPVEVKMNAEKKIPGAPEPGLIAVNAPAMWALGYTGRARLVYNYDTGVWPNHPTIAERFLANYYPVEQCWYGYYSDVPTGEYNSHGTHTLGTMIGLDDETDDTIGVAFKSYWIANDLVRGTVEELPPISDMVLAFEWALDPDGNPSTTFDIPDVINNSWRWYDGADTAYCGGFVEDMLLTLEAAGIAVVFSGGNHGPGNTTVSSPQRVKTSLVNSFSVGALNGNDPQLPIANFSTRGPSQCTDNVPLNIHPEVSAPGVNVRSAYGEDGYSELSGTSMACPHVAGAVLLLKEAFPYLAGEEILFALYNTAIDLGEPGEDNTFGNGIIDVYEAFLYLSQTHTPVSPDYENDVAITSVDVENCTNVVAPAIEVSNLGNTPISSFTAYYEINGEAVQQIEHNEILATGETIILNFQEQTLDTNRSELFFNIVPNESLDEVDFFNNRRITHVSYYDETEPFFEDFEDDIALFCWEQEFISGTNQWCAASRGYGSIPPSPYSGEVNAYFYSAYNDITKLILPQMDLSSFTNPALKFWHAQGNFMSFQDILKVFYRKSASDPWTMINEYSESINVWTEQTILLPEPSSEYFIAFEGNSFSGRGICIDDIEIINSFGIEKSEFAKEEIFSINPNPTSGKLYINCKEPSKNQTNIIIRDISGVIVYTKSIEIDISKSIDISNLQDAMYSITISNKMVTETKKLLLAK